MIIILFFAAGAVVGVTHYISIPWFTPFVAPIVFGLMGIAALMDGIRTIRSGEMRFRFRQENYAGFPARLWGVWILVVGFALLPAAVLSLLNPAWEEMAVHTPQGWGFFLLLLGLLAGIYGIIRILAGEAYYRAEVKHRLQDFASRVEGMVMTLVGLLFIGAGAMLTLFPAPFVTFFK